MKALACSTVSVDNRDDTGANIPPIVWIMAALAIASGLTGCASMIRSFSEGHMSLNLNIVGLLIAANLLRGHLGSLYLVLAILAFSALVGVGGGLAMILKGLDDSQRAGVVFVALGVVSAVLFWWMCARSVGAWFVARSQSNSSLPAAYWAMLLVGLVVATYWSVDQWNQRALVKSAYPVNVHLSITDQKTGHPVTGPVRVSSDLMHTRPTRSPALPKLWRVVASSAEASNAIELTGILTGQERITIEAEGYRQHVVRIGDQRGGREEIEVRLFPDRP